MWKPFPFLFTACFGLGVALLGAQNIVRNPAPESGMAHVTSGPSSSSAVKGTEATLQKYGKLPLSFERYGESEFVARGQGYAIDIHGARATIALTGSGVSTTVGMEFVHGRQATANPQRELPGKANYIFGKDPQNWRLGLPTYERVAYANVYPGVDVVYYGNQRQLEFDLVLKPGADVQSIRMRFPGAGKLRTDPSGSLVLGDLRLMVPTVIQGQQTIPSRYKLLRNDEVAFEVGAYDRRQPLIIDPTLVYSTRLGGGNGGNQGNAIALDSTGNAYIAGYTNASDFPVINPAYAGYQANTDSFISKMNSAGTALIYSTYVGGSNYDYLQGIAVDSTGAAWAVGYTLSSDFPLLSPYQGTLGGGNDAVVLKLNPSGAFAYSTLLGGASDDVASAVAVDPFGNAYVTGRATVGFPTTGGVYQPVSQGSDAFVTKLSSSGSLLWSTFMGGASFDYATGIAADSFGNSYVTGGTFSTAFPNVPPGGAQPTNRGNGDAFVAKLNFNASALIYFTFVGGSGTDSAWAIAVDPIGGMSVVAGSTTSIDLSTSAGAVQSANAGGYDGFVAKLNTAGSAFLYATYLGGNRRDIILGVAMDPKGNAYLAGYTDSNTFPTKSAIQPAIQGNTTSLFRTSNTGASWTPFDTNLPGAAFGVAPDPVNAGTIIVSTDNGTFRTTNGGSTWTEQTVVGYMTLARSLANPLTVYGVTGSQVYQSTDNGITWSFRGSLLGCCGERIVADPIDTATAYVIQSFNTSLPAVQKTVDNGVNWSPATTGLPVNALATAMVAGSDGSLYAGLWNAGLSPGGLYKSTNQGASWVPLKTGIPSNLNTPPQGLAVAPSDPSVLYVTDYFTLFKSLDGGTSWSTIGVLPGGTTALAVSSTTPSTLYYAAYNSMARMWASTDSGASWSPATGVGVAALHSIAIFPDPLNGPRAYALALVSVLPVVAKVDAAGKNLLYSTYLGDYGSAYGIATNGTGDAFVTGSTWEFPTTPSALQRNRSYIRNNLDGFIARISDATAACSYSVDPAQSLELWFPHVIQYVVTAPSGCSWTASSDQSWATIPSGARGSGSGIVYVLVADNETPDTRSATLSIAGQSIPLAQRPGRCGYNFFSPDTAVVPGGGGTVEVTLVAGAGCEWTTINNDPTAVTLVSGAAGTGSGTVTMTVAPNLGPNTRTFVIGSPQGGSETITQEGTTAPAVVATITSMPSGAEIRTSGTGCIPGTYTTPAHLTWNANTNCTIRFTSPQFIGGSQYEFNSATVNDGPSRSTNPLTLNSGTSAPRISASFLPPCSYSLAPTGQAFGAQGGLGVFVVNTAPTCSWTPVPSASWITIMPSASKGPGRVNYAIGRNPGGPRTGTISVGGQHHTVVQQFPTCSFSITPSGGAFDDTGGNARVVVTAPAGCPWTATSNAGWMSVTSGASGNGTGTVMIKAFANSGGRPRSGTVRIAGRTFSATQGADACGALDVTPQVEVRQSPLRWVGLGLGPDQFLQTISLRNRSQSAAVPGPVYLVMLGQPQIDSGGLADLHGSGLLAPPAGLTYCFSAKGDYLLPVSGALQPNETVGLNLHWIIEILASGYFQAKVVSGTPSR